MLDFGSRWAAPLGAAAAAAAVIGVTYAVVSETNGDSRSADPGASVNSTITDVSSSPSTVESTPSPTPEVVRDVVDRQREDLDGDGLADQVTMLFMTAGTFPDSTQTVELRVELASGEATSVEWPLEYEWGLQPAVDLDGDGDREVVAHGGGGEFGIYRFFDAEEGPLRSIASVGVGGKRVALTSSGGSTEWESTLLGNGDLVDFRWLSQEPGTPPFTVQFRRWTLDGMTLTLSSMIESGCYALTDYRAQITSGAC